MIIGKKSQQEIVGFVIIVIIICVVGLIFLSLMLSNARPVLKNSVEISNLLEATMYYTTDCAINFIPEYQNIRDLVKEGFENPNEKCIGDENVIVALNRTVTKVLSESLQISPDSPNKAYKFIVYYKDLSISVPDRQFLNLNSGNFGNCSYRLGAFDTISTGGGIGALYIELSVCKG